MKLFFTLSLIAISMTGAAQELKHCGTDAVMKKIYGQHPELLLKIKEHEKTISHRAYRPNTASLVIPVVFHILHVGGVENISDAQVRDGLRILNRDYGKQNPDTTEIIPEFKNIADSAGIRFVLATKDPAGNCSSGIVHYYDTDTDWNDQSPSLYSHTWDPTRYMNVYIVRSITLSNGFNASGYTYYPGTWLSGDPFDAIVVLNNYFGSIGTSIDFTSRVLTHEAGHWFNLAHIFGYMQGAGIDCSDDDFVADTPPTAGYLSCPNAAVPAQYQNCTPGISENFQNYMDYSYCCRMFTQGQAQRMQAALQDNTVGRNNLWTNSNLIACGVINPTVPCLPIADFKYNRSKTCVGTAITFTDASWNGAATSYSWTFPGGSPAASNLASPVVTYASPGLYSVSYTSANSAGTSAPLTRGNIINVTANTALFTGPSWTEGFEDLSVVNNEWSFGSSNGSSNWQQSADAFYSGAFAAKLSKTNNTRKTVTYMSSPSVNLSNITSPVLTFMLAAAEVTPNHVNTLKVYSSVDCGDTWSVIYSKTGQALVTSSTSVADFIPNHSNWRFEAISLQAIATAPYATFKFEYTRDSIAAAQNMYLDDINIASVTAIEPSELQSLQNLAVFPVPSKGNLTVSFGLLSKQKIKFSLTDILGKTLELISEQEFDAGEHTQVLDLQNKIPGIYFLSMHINGTLSTRKIIIEE